MHPLSRRRFLELTGALAGSVTLSTAMSGCSLLAGGRPLSAARFEHGVASGDPTGDGLIIWTRATPIEGDATQPVTLNWELALDREFTKLVRSGQVDCSASNDFTVKIDVRELSSGRDYFYRFQAKDEYSPVGKGKTLPAGSVDRVKFAVFSCSNYPAGYFNVYEHASGFTDIDYALHLGDFIYEYSDTGYASENAQRIGRTLADDNRGELFTVNDYRKRYAHYYTDRGLQALNAAVPVIAVWDDHEICNDTWNSGGENHNPGEGDFEARKLAAIQAYYEWVPIRPPMGEQSERIYRSFEFGDLVGLHMLDTRIIGRSKQLAMADFVDSNTGQFDQKGFQQALFDPQRSLLGEEQLGWLNQQVKQSKARWQLLGQQVLMGKMWFPAAAMAGKDRSKAGETIGHLATLKQKSLRGQKLAEQEQQMLQRKLPYNLDAWDGYPVEREMLYRTLAEKQGNVVVVAGDTHNAWHSKLIDKDGHYVGVEFATPSVSSPGMEHYLSLEPQTAEQLAKALPLLVDDLEYCNLKDRGHLQLTFSREEVVAEWLYVDNIESPEYRLSGRHQHVLSRA
ncbi:alkaline phosphatase D [Litorivivens lipolytica]|uniref:Alkaline phosphatase D n=1 Tax=Litorivivens lipolytica TaxID=1524264 RepID=A0A7W4W4I9_9GAMM|nr:alkaline phosphatase D family protein [Litorivivens lipolytica]MBB3046754.1 alkaline phosphatase D [Litorivivens lipolytica]